MTFWQQAYLESRFIERYVCNNGMLSLACYRNESGEWQQIDYDIDFEWEVK